jgi:hypothetical protein
MISPFTEKIMLNHPYPIGTKVRLRKEHQESGMDHSTTYTIGQVDCSDSTYRVRSPDGALKSWISFTSLQPATGIGWDFLKEALPGEALDILAAFKGLDALELDDQVIHHILSNLPDLQDRILEAVHSLESEASAAKKAA